MNCEKVIYFGAVGASGYANAANGYVYDLIQSGKEVYFQAISGAHIKDDTQHGSFFTKNVKKLPLFNRDAKLKDAEVVLHITPELWSRVTEQYADLFGDRKIVGRTVWDFDPLPTQWVNAINTSNVNVVSVPSQWNKDVFTKSGVKKDIVVEPHIVPSIPYTKTPLMQLLSSAKIFSPASVNFGNFQNRVKFLCTSTLVWRKNLAFAIDSYLSTFSHDDETLLLIKLTDHQTDVDSLTKTIQSIIAAKIKNKEEQYLYAPIVLLTDTFNFDQMQSLYDACDVYLNSSRGEGFNIPCYTASIKNKRIVSPLHGGLLDYLSNYNKLHEVNYHTVRIDSLDKQNNKKIGVELDQKLTRCIDVSYDDFCQSLKCAYNECVQNLVYFTKYDSLHPYPLQTEDGSLFPIYFKNGWYNEQTHLGVWNNGSSMLCVGQDVYKLEIVIECIQQLTFRLSVNDVVYEHQVKRGKHVLKIVGKQNKTIKFESATFDGNKIGRSADCQYGIKIVDVYVNGIRNSTSRIVVNHNNFVESILKVNNYLQSNSNVIDKGEYGDIIIKFTDHGKLGKYPKKLNLGRQLSFYSHRSGWNYVLQQMSIINSESGVYCDGFLENNFSWRKSEMINQKVIPYNKTWIGFIHNPPNMPPWFSDNNAYTNTILNDPYFVDSLRKCKGIFTLSEYHAKFIRNYIPFVKVESLLHPTEIPEQQFDFDAFVKNPDKKLVTIGWWLRKLNALYKVNAQGYQKVRLLPNNKCRDTIFRLEKIEEAIESCIITEAQKQSVQVWEHIPNDEYDALLTNNVVYLDLYDSSANNGIIECIARCTPLFINRLPAIAEYLGDDYPLYIDNQLDLETKLCNYDLIQQAHVYLKKIRYKVEIDHFLNSLTNTEIYKNL